jgi:hypothetical protein
MHFLFENMKEKLQQKEDLKVKFSNASFAWAS